MALHNSFKQGQSQQQDTRLASAPSADELGSALSQARKSGKRPVVMSWKSSKTADVFWLSVTASGAGNEAEWLLQKGAEGVQPKDVWNHKTTDTALIQSLLAAEEEMAFKSGNRTLVTPPPANGQTHDESPWHAAGLQPGTITTGSNSPIVLNSGSQPSQRPESAPAAQTPWQGAQAPGWNSPQPAPEQLGWGYLPPNQSGPAAPSDNPSQNSGSNPFAGLKGTGEEPKPSNPFNSLMSNQNLPQLPPQTKQIDLPEIPLKTSGHKFVDDGDDSNEQNQPPVNTYDGLTTSNQGMKTIPAAQKEQPPKPQTPPTPSTDLPRLHSSQYSSSTRIPVVTPGGAHLPGAAHPPVPNFAAMTSSGAYPVVNVSPDQALNPKPQPRGAMSVNQVKGNTSQQSGSYNQQPQQGTTQNQQIQRQSSTHNPQLQRQSSAHNPQIQRQAAQNLVPSNKPLPAPVELDRAAVDNVFKSLSNPETGLLNHGSMLFFLVREFSRYQINGQPFSLIIMEMNVLIEGPGGQQVMRPLPPRAVRIAAQKIFSLTRQLDLVSHYEQSDFAVLLPATCRQEAKDFAQSLIKLLLAQPLSQEMEKNSVILRLGLASFPEDTSHPGILLAAAAEAKAEALQSGKTLVVFGE